MTDESTVLQRELARLQRACEEGLPRERIHCPRCGTIHIDGADTSAYGKRPHHTHRCQPENGGCGHEFDTGRWSYGADVPPDPLKAAQEKLQEFERALAAERIMAATYRSDAEHLGHVVGRSTVELLFINHRNTRQTPSAHVLADGRAYAPILGPATPASASLEELTKALERAFGDGFRFVSSRTIQAAR